MPAGGRCAVCQKLCVKLQRCLPCITTLSSLLSDIAATKPPADAYTHDHFASLISKMSVYASTALHCPVPQSANSLSAHDLPTLCDSTWGGPSLISSGNQHAQILSTRATVFSLHRTYTQTVTPALQGGDPTHRCKQSPRCSSCARSCRTLCRPKQHTDEALTHATRDTSPGISGPSVGPFLDCAMLAWHSSTAAAVRLQSLQTVNQRSSQGN